MLHSRRIISVGASVGLLVAIVFVLVASFALPQASQADEHKGHNGGWKQAPEDRFGYVGHIVEREGNRVGNAFAIDEHIALSAAHIFDMHGENVIFVIGGHNSTNKSDDQGYCIQMKPNKIIFHPDWDGVIDHGNDAAVMYFLQPIGVDVPTLADPKLSLEEVDNLLALQSGNTTQMALCNVVANHSCPEISELSSSSFCVFSPSLEWQQGATGGPIIIPDSHVCDGIIHGSQCGRAGLDLVVGHISYANYSHPHSTGAVIMQTMGMRHWLDDIRETARNHQAATHNLYWIQMLIAMLMILMGWTFLHLF